MTLKTTLESRLERIRAEVNRAKKVPQARRYPRIRKPLAEMMLILDGGRDEEFLNERNAAEHTGAESTSTERESAAEPAESAADELVAEFQTNQATAKLSSRASRPALRIMEAENRALRAILGAHVDGINIDEELEFVGPTGRYRPQAAPAQPQEAPPQQDNRSSRRQSVSNTRAEETPQVDVAAIDKQFDDFMQNMYGFNFDEGGNDA